MTHPKKRIVAIAAGSATAVLAGATAGVGVASAAPQAASPDHRATTGQNSAAQQSKFSVALNRNQTGAHLSYGKAQLAAKGQHVSAAKAAMPAKKKKKGKRARVS